MQTFYKFFTVIIISSIFITSCSNNSQDDTQENPIATCDAAIHISIDETLNESLEISWTTTDKFDIYEIEYGQKDFQLGNGNKLTTIEKAKTIENLEVNSEYEIYVRGKCAAGYGEWFGPVAATTICANGFYEGDVELKSQEEVNAFGALCYTGVNGNLIINGEGSNDPITDLSPMLELIEIKGSLTIRWNALLESLTGFDNLTQIGSLSLIGNVKLSSINSLKNLERIDGDFPENIFSGILIDNVSLLKNLHGLEQIKKVKNLKINFNTSIETLEGLENLEEIEETLQITVCRLNSLSALKKLRKIGNTISTSIAERNSKSAIIIYHSNLLNFKGLEDLTFVGGEIYIAYNALLETLDGLENIERMEYLRIQHNPKLKNLGTIDLSGIELVFIIENCLSITDFQGVKFEKENNIIWAFNDCNGLTSLKGLEGITTAIALNITNNENLISLDGLQGLNRLDGNTVFRTSINENRNLTDACALSNLYLNGTYDTLPNLFLGDDTSINNRLEIEDFENGTCRR